ncbi:hypothetical protein PTKIN_Ptkin11bG0063400 [Pterospermum kingtungense]
MQGRSRRKSLELPETVVEDILSKLPVKSLLRFSSLAIDDVEYFSALSTEKGDSFLVKENIDFLGFYTGWFTSIVYCPCNGLFCLSYDCEVALWNPLTREFKFLPQSLLQSHPLGKGQSIVQEQHGNGLATTSIAHDRSRRMLKPSKRLAGYELY